MFKKMKDPVSGLTHLLGAILAIPCTVMLIIEASIHATPWHIVSFSIFGASLILLYTASSIYHLLPISEKATVVLRRIDHMMIFVLIAGTYTPICLVPLRGVWGYSLLIAVWVIATAGILLKAFWINAPRWLSTGIYVLMGWIVVFAFYPLCKSISTSAIILLTAGGVAYTLGAVIYAVKWPRFNLKGFGFHEIFHLFVMGGSALHVVFMFFLIL